MSNKLDLGRIKDVMDREGLDALLAASPENVFYLSDLPTLYTSPNRLLYVVRNDSPSLCLFLKDGDAKLILTAAAVELAKLHSWVEDIRPYRTGVYIVRPKEQEVKEFAVDAYEALEKTVKELGVKRIGYDAGVVSKQIADNISRCVKGLVELVDATEVFKELRMIKSEEELRRYRKANEILCKAIWKVISEMRVGVEERELVALIKETILKEGGDSWHQTTIAVGPQNGPNIYNQPSGRRLKKGDIVRIDVGCVYRGYSADLSVTVAIGEAPPEAKKIFNVIETAERMLIDECRPGVRACDIFKLGEDYVKKELDPNYRRGNLGHGIGIELYDRPFISANDTTELSPGMTLSIEVPYHKYGLSGFNMEDSVIITKSGHEVVSDLPHELLVV